jgi:hypothetical protein
MDLSWGELLRYGAEQFLLQGAWLAIQIAALAMIGGIGLGLGLALMRLSSYRRIVFRIGIHIGDVIEDNTSVNCEINPRQAAPRSRVSRTGHAQKTRMLLASVSPRTPRHRCSIIRRPSVGAKCSFRALALV